MNVPPDFLITRPRLRPLWTVLAPCFAALGLAQAQAQLEVTEVTLSAARDNTLYESLTGEFSNAFGDFFFAGRSGQTEPDRSIRRGLLAFNLSAIPADAVVLSAELRLYMDQTVAGDTEIAIHRLENDWGEATSDASGVAGEGTGVLAGANDATWVHTFYQGEFWNTAGGDFAPAASAVAIVGADFGYKSWCAPRMAADLRYWLANPLQNHGWLVIGDESTRKTAKRFVSRNSIDLLRHPRLVVRYTTTSTPLPASPRIRIELSGEANQDVTIRFQGNTGELYFLEQCNDLKSWRPTPQGTPGAGTELLLSDPGAGAANGTFYQVQVMPDPEGN